MPTYEYECPRCPRVFEVRQRISEPALTTCEVCGGPIHRLIAAAPFILKGEGWYVTDYPSESRKKALSSESSGDKASAGSEQKSAAGSASPSSSSSTSSGASGSSSSSDSSSSSSDSKGSGKSSKGSGKSSKSSSKSSD